MIIGQKLDCVNIVFYSTSSHPYKIVTSEREFCQKKLYNAWFFLPGLALISAFEEI